MARALAQAVDKADDLVLSTVVSARGRSAEAIAMDLAAAPLDAVVCDFTHPLAFDPLLDALDAHPRPLVAGTSGLEPEQAARLKAYAGRQPVIWGNNFSMGAVIARILIESLGRLAAYDQSWQAAIVDFHHDKKLDPESATARDWAAAWREGSGGRIAPVSAIRLGDGVSEHSLIAAGRSERLEIVHKVLARQAPAAGALAAARFVAGRTPGLYQPGDLLQK